MVQPKAAVGADTAADGPSGPALCELGCLGRITAFQESGDGRYLINLSGVARYRILDETLTERGYRRARIEIVAADLAEDDNGKSVDREACSRPSANTSRPTTWRPTGRSKRASNGSLVTALCMMSPYGPAEKQALLERATCAHGPRR